MNTYSAVTGDVAIFSFVICYLDYLIVDKIRNPKNSERSLYRKLNKLYKTVQHAFCGWRSSALFSKKFFGPLYYDITTLFIDENDITTLFIDLLMRITRCASAKLLQRRAPYFCLFVNPSSGWASTTSPTKPIIANFTSIKTAKKFIVSENWLDHEWLQRKNPTAFQDVYWFDGFKAS